LKLRVCGSKSSDYEWLIQAEAAQRRERRYLSLPSGFVSAFQSANRKPSQALLTLAAELKHQSCAGMLFLVHGSTATYHLGWADDAGREHSAHNLLLWQACSLLAERGVQQLDLGGVNTQSNPGLARFKLGAGGRVVTWAGTYW
jgi:lipid II:glycine glycyltransferase (peptidoglycan interpeptide bridge formation enzyme)